MPSDMRRLAAVIDRQASAAERALTRFRQAHRNHQQALGEVEQSRGICERKLRQATGSAHAAVTPQQLSDASHDRSACLSSLRDLSTQASELRANVSELHRQRGVCARKLARLKNKSDYLRRQAARVEKRGARRRAARDIAVDGQ